MHLMALFWHISSNHNFHKCPLYNGMQRIAINGNNILSLQQKSVKNSFRAAKIATHPKRSKKDHFWVRFFILFRHVFYLSITFAPVVLMTELTECKYGPAEMLTLFFVITSLPSFCSSRREDALPC